VGRITGHKLEGAVFLRASGCAAAEAEPWRDHQFCGCGRVAGVDGVHPSLRFESGVIMLTRCLAKELAPEVRVNAIAPGTITMPGDPPEWEEDFIKRAPLLRSGRPSDVAETVVFLVRSELLRSSDRGGWRSHVVNRRDEREFSFRGAQC